MAEILIVDDEAQIRRLIEKALDSANHSIQSTASLAEGLAAVRTGNFDLVFLDLVLPDGYGLDALPKFIGQECPGEVVIITGAQDSEGAKYAIENGVFDYIQKPLRPNDIRLTCERALEFKALRCQKPEIKLFKREGIVGKEARLEKCLEQTAKAAAVDSNVLITGETGTGKELVARALHENSSRADQNLIVVDCAALKSSLMESILFGHEKGAFTGAESRQQGRVSLAHNGTLFLDEIGELELDAQKRFLRLLNNRSFYPLGAKSMVTSNFRLVCATNRDLEREVAENRFRPDLYYRICGHKIHLPPLRERNEDIRELVYYYMERICQRMQIPRKKIYPEFLEALSRYDWPGNVRELINTIDAAISNFPRSPALHTRHLPTQLRAALCHLRMKSAEPTQTQPALADQIDFNGAFPEWKIFRRKTVDSLEEQYFQALHTYTKGSAKEMAKISGLTQPRIYELFKKHEFQSSS